MAYIGVVPANSGRGNPGQPKSAEHRARISEGVKRANAEKTAARADAVREVLEAFREADDLAFKATFDLPKTTDPGFREAYFAAHDRVTEQINRAEELLQFVALAAPAPAPAKAPAPARPQYDTDILQALLHKSSEEAAVILRDFNRTPIDKSAAIEERRKLAAAEQRERLLRESVDEITKEPDPDPKPAKGGGFQEFGYMTDLTR